MADAKVKRGRSSQQKADSPSSSQRSKKSNVLERNVRVSLFNKSSEVQPAERMSSQFRPIAPAITDNTQRVLPVYLRNDQEKPRSSKQDGPEEGSVVLDIMKHSGLRKYQAKSLPLNSKPFPSFLQFLPRIIRLSCFCSLFFLFFRVMLLLLLTKTLIAPKSRRSFVLHKKQGEILLPRLLWALTQ